MPTHFDESDPRERTLPLLLSLKRYSAISFLSAEALTPESCFLRVNWVYVLIAFQTCE